MPLALRLALGGVSRGSRDHAVYLVALALAVCLLYSFNASGDYLMTLPLTADQVAVVAKARDVTGAFSVFVVVVFVVLAAFANRFVTRRRSRELALYAILGMRPPAVAAVLAAEGVFGGVVSLVAGLALGFAASPAFGMTAAFVFGTPWGLAWSFSASAAALTCGWFAVIELCALALSVVDVLRRPLAELVARERAPERLVLTGRAPTRAQAVLAVALLAVVWGSCVAQPGLFVLSALPMGWAAYVATSLVFRLIAAGVPRLLRRHDVWWRGLTAFVARRLEARVSTGSQMLSCACALLACAVCMLAAGLAFSVGQRAALPSVPGAPAEASLAPIGYVGIFYGEAFMLAAVTLLALYLLSQTGDDGPAYAALRALGAGPRETRASLRVQLGAAFALPAAMALAHDAAGLTLVRQLAMNVPADVFGAIAAGSVGGTLVVLVASYLACVRACERVVLDEATARA